MPESDARSVDCPFSDVSNSGRVWRKGAGKLCWECDTARDDDIVTVMTGAQMVVRALGLNLFVNCFCIARKSETMTASILKQNPNT